MTIYILDSDNVTTKMIENIVSIAIYPYLDALNVAAKLGLQDKILPGKADYSYLLAKDAKKRVLLYPLPADWGVLAG